MASRRLQVEIIGDSSSLTRALGKSSTATGGFGKSLLKTAAITGAVIGGFRLLTGAIGGSVRAAEEAEVAQKRMQAQLRALGIDYQAHAKTIDTVLQKQSNLSAFDDEDLQNSFTALARVTKDVNKALDLNALAADIARGKGIDLSAATMLVTKAAMGQVGALKRQGIEIDKVTAAHDALGKNATQAQKDAAKAADLAATKQKALALLNQKFAGQAEAYGKTAAGAQERFKVALENLGEVIGGKILPAMTPLIQATTDFINAAAKSETLAAILDGVGAAVGRVLEDLKGLIEPTKEVVGFFKDHKTITQALTVTMIGLTAAVIAYEIVEKAVTKATQAWMAAQLALSVVLRASPIGLTIVAVALLAAGLVILWKTSDTFRAKMTAAFDAVRPAWNRLSAAAVAAWNAIRPIIDNIVRVVRGMVDLVAGIFTGDWARAWSGLKQVALGGWNLFKAWMFTLPTMVLGWSKDIGSAIIKGIAAGMGALLQWLLDQAGALVSKVKDKLLFWSSPPEAFGKHVTQRLLEGMVEGIKANQAKLLAAVREALDQAKQVVLDMRESFRAAFDDLVSAALAAFDKLAEGAETATEKILRLREAARAAKEIADAVKEAQAAYEAAVGAAIAGQAQKEGESDEEYQARLYALGAAIVAAQESLDAALYAQQTAALEKRAEAERTAQDEKDARRRQNLVDELADAEAYHEKHKTSTAAFLLALKRILAKYHIPMQQAGAIIGFALAHGLRSAFDEVTAAAQALTQAIKDEFEKLKIVVSIELSAKDKKPGKPKGLTMRAGGGPVLAGMPYIVGERGPELFLPRQSGSIIPSGNTYAMAGGVSIVVNAPNYVGDKRDLAEAMQEVVGRFVRNNGGSFFPG